MLKLYEKKGTIPMSESEVEKRDFSVEEHVDYSATEMSLLGNSTNSTWNANADIFRRADVTGLGMKFSTYVLVRIRN